MRNTAALFDKKLTFERYVTPPLRHLSVYHFSSIFLWQDFFDFEFEIIEETLCVYANQDKASFLYLPPLAEVIKPSIIEHCFARMNKVNPRVARVENVEESQLHFFDGRYKAFNKSAEYVYRRQDLIDLKGVPYKSQRHDINHFETRHRAVFRPFEDKDKSGCLDLYSSWAKGRHDKHQDEVYRQMLEENAKVHELALTHYRRLGLLGFVVDIDGKIAAYSFGYSLNSRIFCVLLEITNGTTGLNAYIFNRVCADGKLGSHTLINTMDDFGLPHVAASKGAYHPQQRPISYTVTLK